MEMQISSPGVLPNLWFEGNAGAQCPDRDELSAKIVLPAGNLAARAWLEDDVVYPAGAETEDIADEDTVPEGDDLQEIEDGLEAARGGNYKVVRQNLQKNGKANGKKPMTPLRKKLRQRKRKSK